MWETSYISCARQFGSRKVCSQPAQPWDEQLKSTRVYKWYQKFVLLLRAHTSLSHNYRQICHKTTLCSAEKHILCKTRAPTISIKGSQFCGILKSFISQYLNKPDNKPLHLPTRKKKLQNGFSLTVYLFKPPDTPTKKDRTTHSHNLVTLQQLLKIFLKNRNYENVPVFF